MADLFGPDVTDPGKTWAIVAVNQRPFQSMKVVAPQMLWNGLEVTQKLLPFAFVFSFLSFLGH